MPITNENLQYGLREDDQFQVGVSDVDPGDVVESDVKLPWPSTPLVSWVYYDCTLAVILDSGIVVHNHLPQVNNTYDTLSSCDMDDPRLDNIINDGVNLKCRDQYRDIVQRMGHSRYWFRLWGQALRVAHKVPIPGIKLIGGVAAIPYDKNPQWAFNRIAPGGNYGGVVLWHAAWSLWYTTAVPPLTNDVPGADPVAKVSTRTPLPDARGIQAPYSQPDDSSTQSGELNLFTILK